MKKTRTVLFVLLAACWLPAASSCHSRQGAGGGEIVLVPAERIAGLRRQLQQHLAELRARTCPRRALLDPPLPGDVGPEMTALVDDTNRGGCADALARHAEQLAQGMPEHFPRTGTAPQSAYRPPAWLGDLERTCQPVLERLQRVARCRQGCSPFRPGLAKEPDPRGLVRLARLVAHLAWAREAAGNDTGALRLLLPALRSFQDLARGGTSLLLTVVSIKAQQTLLPPLGAVLDRPLSRPRLEEAARKLALLLDGHVHPATYLPAEYLALELNMFLPMLGPGEPQPAGGAPAVPLPAFPAGDLPEGVSSAQAAALAILAAEGLREELVRSCRLERPPARCLEGLRRIEKRLSGQPPSRWEMLGRLALSTDKQRALLEQVLEMLQGVLAPAYSKYLEDDHRLLEALAALRLQAELRAGLAGGGACPAREGDLPGPLQALARDPWSGERLRLQPAAGGLLAGGSAPGAESPGPLFISCQRP